MDAYWRAGTLGDHKEKADIAVEEAAKEGQKVDIAPSGLNPGLTMLPKLYCLMLMGLPFYAAIDS